MALTTVLAQDAPKPRNAIIFVADGLRHDSVNATDTPAFARVRSRGVYFSNSHAVFPTQTMPNAAAIATGHYPGDTGQFANQIFVNYPLFDRSQLGPRGTITPEVEEGIVMADLNGHFGGNFLREASLVAFARSYGYNTAAVGKTGPAALQDVSDVMATRGKMRSSITIIIDSSTGQPGAVPMSEGASALLKSAGLPPVPPPRDQPDGTNDVPGAKTANVDHQKWFADAVTRAILPAFAKSPEPFVLVFWSGDPDQTQHAQGDSRNRLVPGIRNADRNLQQILDWLDAHPEVRDSTNLFVTSDHGFSIVSRSDVDASGRATASYSATLRYVDETGRQEVNPGDLPPGCLAIDLANHLNLPLYDTAVQTTDASGIARYVKVDPTIPRPGGNVRQRPSSGVAAIGGSGRVLRPTDASVVIAQTSIYVTNHDRDMVTRIVRFLAAQDYVGGLFVHNRFGQVPGALPMSDVGLVGTATMPRPSIVVNFKSFSRDAASPSLTGVSVWGTRQHGQGDHGSLSRANTFINMAAMGPDFRRGFVDRAPVGNADIQPTLAHVMKMKFRPLGRMRGRVITEALAGGAPVRFASRVARSRPDAGTGLSTVLMYQVADNRIYLDEACFTRASTCR